MSWIDSDDRYGDYAAQFDQRNADRQARRKRKAQVSYKPKKSQNAILTELADDTTAEGVVKSTYQPSRYEEGWLLNSLKDYYQQSLITDVLGLVKGGKEASVYRCRAHPTTGYALLAAKVYRPRQFRQLRNDKMYREGRLFIDEDGKQLNIPDARIARALDSKSKFGVHIEHQSWLGYEFNTLKFLYSLGALVPKPISQGENAILMTYCGTEDAAAQPLCNVNLPIDEAEEHFHEVIENISLMLSHGLIHGDLSAYNILCWEGQISLIDFPQVSNAYTNTQAQFIFNRDVVRVCDYFASQGVDCDGEEWAGRLWKRHISESPRHERAADLSRLEPIEE